MASRFSFRFVRLATLPQLAWCARIQRNHSEVSVWHGASVERAPDDSAFHEGAWSGDYSKHRIDEALTFTGSGARITGDTIRFATATHTLEPIHTMRRDDDLFCSNSLHFLLALADDSIDPRYLYYDADLMSIMFGLRRYVRSIPTAGGRRVRQRYHCNLNVSANLCARLQPKDPVPEFSRYSEYVSLLTSQTQTVTDNASAPERSVAYAPLATISSGYDSPACATIGRAAGCRNGLTFTSARPGFKDRDDSGAPIARTLGMSITELDFFAMPHQRSDYPEAEFIASGHGGDDTPMMVAEPYLTRKLLYSGYHGDKAWDKNLSHPTPYIVRGDPSGSSLAEFRFRVGFINFPIVFIGCTRQASIYAISNSSEMRPWSLGTAYDRPIPRRMVEEAGVPRRMFGQSKKAVTMPYQNHSADRDPDMSEVLCDASYSDFCRFIDTHAFRQHRIQHVHFDLMHSMYRVNQRVAWSSKLRRMLGPLAWTVPDHVIIPWKYAKARAVNSLAFHWAAAKMRNRYRQAIQVLADARATI